jgi:hypothetical protein
LSPESANAFVDKAGTQCHTEELAAIHNILIWIWKYAAANLRPF